MGQRLCINIVDKDNHVLANGYYHWSAYTESALHLSQSAIETFYENHTSFNGRELAIKMLEATGAGVNEDERLAINNDRELCSYDYKDCTGRNDGILSVTERGIRDTENWAEGMITINIDTETLCLDVCYWDEAGYLEEAYGEDLTFSYEDLPQFPFDSTDCSFNDIEALLEFIEHNPHGCKYDGGWLYWVD